MNLQSIVITNCIGIFLCLNVVVCNHSARRQRTLEDKTFNTMLLMVAVSCFMEMMSFLLDGHVFPGAFALSLLCNTGTYLANVSFTLIWTLYIDYKLYHSRDRLIHHYLPMIIVTSISILTILGNLFGRYLFDFTESNVYFRKDLAYVFFILPVIYVIQSIVNVVRYNRRHVSMGALPIWAFVVPFFFGCILQALIYGISLGWCSSSIGLTALYMCLQNELVFQDPLTHLYNRHYLNSVLSSLNAQHGTSCLGIMIDVDYFKEINDTYGHSKGDQALCDVAEILLKSVTEHDDVIRFAGDEFIILCQNSNEQMAEDICQKIQDSTAEFNKEGIRPYRLSLSLGKGTFIPGTSTSDKFLEEMDRHMYENKHRTHNQYR